VSKVKWEKTKERKVRNMKKRPTLRVGLGRQIFSFIGSITLIASLHIGSFAQTCSISPNLGTVATNWDNVFTQNGPGTGLEPSGSAGWTGADSTYSILLPNGNTAFFFSDSYIAESPAKSGDATVTTNANGLRTRQTNCGPPLCDPPASLYRAHNSIVVRNTSGTTLTTKVGAKDGFGYSTSYFKPTNTNHFYWMGDATVVQTTSSGTKKVWVFLMEFDNSWTYYGSAIAQLNASTLAIESINTLTNTPDLSIGWGSAMWLDGSYGNYFLYIYGIKTVNGKKQPFVALTNPGLGVANVKNTNNWFVWNGSNWVTGLNNAVTVAPVNDSISDEYSVKKFTVNGTPTYIMVGMDTSVPYGTWKDIVLYSSCSPQGPFTGKYFVYSTPETGSTKVPGMTANQNLNAGLLTYNPHIHPQFSAAGYMLISYNINWGGNNADTIYADGYRPRFIQVYVPGLQ
jgi:hypothetical protein